MTDEPIILDRKSLSVLVYSSREAASAAAAREIIDLIEARNKKPGGTVLGLATGRSPVAVYEELVRRHRAGLSFSRVESFNLDEYHPIEHQAAGSFSRFMRDHLFDHIDIPEDRRHLPDGSIADREIASHCLRYEQLVAAAGGVDLQILGLGRTGHIGFNEPGSPRDSRTRLVALHPQTIRDNAADFAGGQVPRHAITMGIGTILEARRILLLAFGRSKATVLSKLIDGPVSSSLPASFLRQHPNTAVFADRAAAAPLLSHAAR